MTSSKSLSTLRVYEIFFSLQGETSRVGLPTLFIRLVGCPLRCQYCDTAYAFQGGQTKEIPAIIDDIKQYNTAYVTVTGGEPLAQPGCFTLLEKLCDAGYRVSLETSGALDIQAVDPRVLIIMDLKTPGSGEVARNRYENIDHLKSDDEVKFVICHHDDLEWAKTTIADYRLTERCHILFSPSHEQMEAALIADWILQKQLPVRLQIQLHKYLWGNVPGR